MSFTAGNLRIELAEPIDGPSTWKDQLDRCGPSVQHVAFAVKDVDQTIRALEAKGGKWVLGEANNPFGYVDLRDQLGFTVEVGRQQAPATAPAAPAR